MNVSNTSIHFEKITNIQKFNYQLNHIFRIGKKYEALNKKEGCIKYYQNKSISQASTKIEDNELIIERNTETVKNKNMLYSYRTKLKRYKSELDNLENNSNCSQKKIDSKKRAIQRTTQKIKELEYKVDVGFNKDRRKTKYIDMVFVVTQQQKNRTKEYNKDLYRVAMKYLKNNFSENDIEIAAISGHIDQENPHVHALVKLNTSWTKVVSHYNKKYNEESGYLAFAKSWNAHVRSETAFCNKYDIDLKELYHTSRNKIDYLPIKDYKRHTSDLIKTIKLPKDKDIKTFKGGNYISSEYVSDLYEQHVTHINKYKLPMILNHQNELEKNELKKSIEQKYLNTLLENFNNILDIKNITDLKYKSISMFALYAALVKKILDEFKSIKNQLVDKNKHFNYLEKSFNQMSTQYNKLLREKASEIDTDITINHGGKNDRKAL